MMGVAFVSVGMLNAVNLSVIVGVSVRSMLLCYVIMLSVIRLRVWQCIIIFSVISLNVVALKNAF